MVYNSKILFSVFVLLLVGCASNKSVQSEGDDETPPIVRSISKTIEDYQYGGYQIYPEGLGYSLRYVKENEKPNYADIYVWPVNTEEDVPHQDLVIGVTKQAIGDIYHHVKLGRYSSVEILSQRLYEVGDTKVSKVSLTLVANNLQTLTHLYATEFEGDFLKARMSMSDNDYNRSREDVDKFVLTVFGEIQNYLIEEDM